MLSSGKRHRQQASYVEFVISPIQRSLPHSILLVLLNGLDYTGGNTFLGSMVRAMQTYGCCVRGAGQGVSGYTISQSKMLLSKGKQAAQPVSYLKQKSHRD